LVLAQGQGHLGLPQVGQPQPQFESWEKKLTMRSVGCSGIVMAIAEKVNTMLPGIYDAAEFQ
jgi:hypothetical protein